MVSCNAEKEKSGEKDSPAFNPFGFITDNPSNRSSIHLPESPAEDGNIGQMLYRIEDKGKDYGSYIRSGKFAWLVREMGSAKSRCGAVVFLHGAPTQSFSFRVVMSQLSDARFHCFAPDWIRFDFSDKPQPGYGFDYTEKEYHQELDELLRCPRHQVAFRLSRTGISCWFVRIDLGPEELDFFFKGYLYSEFTCQNAVLAERFIEAGSPYVLKSEKADVYRLPYLSSDGLGFSSRSRLPLYEEPNHCYAAAIIAFSS